MSLRSFALETVSRTSLTPARTAEKNTKSADIFWARIRASVVLPLPGGPHNRREGIFLWRKSLLRILPSPNNSAWPTKSSIRVGRIRSARGIFSVTFDGINLL